MIARKTLGQSINTLTICGASHSGLTYIKKHGMYCTYIRANSRLEQKIPHVWYYPMKSFISDAESSSVICYVPKQLDAQILRMV